uniref:Lysine-specific histone demethylase 1A n=1 Tax=Anthurium amnicola TaxID=1678845 RepID=A0A1D1YXG3_9ARAE
MNDERSLLGEGEAEGDPVTASSAQAEVASASGSRLPRPGMDGSGVAPVPKGEPGPLAEAAGGVSDDDERPIGSLFKVKRSRPSKKRGRPAAEATAIGDPMTEEGALGEMDDTLASLRKKLKTPKRVKACASGSDALRVKNSSFSDKAGDMEDSSKLQRNNSNLLSTKKYAEGAVRGTLEDGGHSSSDGLEDSLSSFFQKAHRASSRRNVPKRKKQVEATVHSGGMTEETANVVLGSPKSALCRETSNAVVDDATPIANEVTKKLAPKKRGRKPRDRSAVELTGMSDTVVAQVKRTHDDISKERMPMDVEKARSSFGRRRGRQRAVNNSRFAPSRMKSNSQKLSSGISIEVTVENIESDADGIYQSSEGIIKCADPQTLNSIGGLNMKDKSAALKDSRSQRENTYDVGLEHTCTGTTSGGVLSGLVHETHCSSVIQTPMEGTNCLDGLKQCSYVKLNDPLSRIVESSPSSVSRKMEEIHDFERHVGPLQESSEGTPPISVVVSQPSEDLSNKPSGENFHGQVTDLCSTRIKQMPGESLTSGDDFNQSLGCLVDKEVDMPLDDSQLNEPFVEGYNEIGGQDDCINRRQFSMSGKQCTLVEKCSMFGSHSCEKNVQNELLVLSSGNLKVPLPSFSDTTPTSTSDIFSQKCDKPFEDLSVSPSARMKKETNCDYNAGSGTSPLIVQADCTSIAVQNLHLTKVNIREAAVTDEFLQHSVMDNPFAADQQCFLLSTGKKEELPAVDDFFKQFPERVSEAQEKSGISSGGLSSVPIQDNPAVMEANSTVPETVTLNPEEFPVPDIAVLPDTELYHTAKQKVPPRVTRKVKRHKHGDMAYEGDADWEVLMRDSQGLFGNTTVNEEHCTGITHKYDSTSHVDLHDGGLAAVAAGLKAHAAGPIEKIKFKDVLKSKGGLQEYIECRNLILSLWSRDVSRILSLEDCGVTSVPSKDDPSRASLIREVYMFLDSSGYINAGIASKREKRQPCSVSNSELSKEDTTKEICGGQVADSKDEDTFSQVNASENDSAEDEKMSPLDAEAKSQEVTVHCSGQESCAQIQSLENAPGNVGPVESSRPASIVKPPMDNIVVNEICPDWKVRQGDRSFDSVMNVQGIASSDYAPHSNKDACLVSSGQQFDGANIIAEMCSDEEARSMEVSCSLPLSNMKNDCEYAQAQNGLTRLNSGSTVPSTKVVHSGTSSISKQVETLSIMDKAVEMKRKEAAHAEPLVANSPVLKHDEVADVDSSIRLDATPTVQCNLEKVCKRIIIVGAGPAGLTAARHLQRQGFSVTVLEARDRIGGRVYTDRSSLSVPVDLGASIITGVEADVATERRADPSSLICTQLGLQLTILNSDCPLYDVVSGKKVPANLDEALEAEYNSLLDDMVVLVAQSGEVSERMSLEDGLEYALKTRRIAQSTSATMEPDQLKFEFSVSSPMITENGIENKVLDDSALMKDVLSPLDRRVMNWHFAHLEYGCAAPLKEVSLPHWNQDDVYGGFGGAHCMIKEGYSTVMETLGEGIDIHLRHAVTDVEYDVRETSSGRETEVRVTTADGSKFIGEAVLITVPLGCLKANTINFSPALPDWKRYSIQRLGFGVLNKVVLEFPQVFWDDTMDYFGATAEETCHRGQCFMFWNVRKTVGAPVLIALVVGRAAIDGQSISSFDHVNHALLVLRKIFGVESVPDPVASVVTNWGMDPFSRGAYSYVAVGASGEDYDILGRPVANCLFFAGEATCKEHPDTVGGAMMSGLREAVRIIDIFNSGNDYTAEVEAMETAQRQADSERNEVKDFAKRLDLCKHANVALVAKESLLQDMFCNAKTISGRLHLAKELLRLPIDKLKSFAGNKEWLSILNSWMLDSMGKDATQLLRHCVRLLVLVSTDLLAVRLSGIGKTVKEKVCVHTSRDIRAIASQLVNVWIEIFRRGKSGNSGLKLLKQSAAMDYSKIRSRDMGAVRQPQGTNEAPEGRGNLQVSSAASYSPSRANDGKGGCSRTTKMEHLTDKMSEVNSSHALQVQRGLDLKKEYVTKSKALAAAEAARAAKAARLATEAYVSSEADSAKPHELPKILSFHKFVRREQYTQMDEFDLKKKKMAGSILGWQDCVSEIDSRNCRVQNWSVDFSATCGNFDGSRLSGDNCTQRSYSNEIMYPTIHKEHSGESEAVDSRLIKAWVDTDTAGSGGVKDSLAIERWQSQAMDADAQFFNPLKDEEDSNRILNLSGRKHQAPMEESSASQAGESKSLVKGQQRGAEHIKQGVVDYVASLLMPLYKARKIDKEGYKSIMKRSATKVMEICTEAEKMMTIFEFLDYRRKNKIRSFVDKLIEKHMSMNASTKS